MPKSANFSIWSKNQHASAPSLISLRSVVCSAIRLSCSILSFSSSVSLSNCRILANAIDELPEAISNASFPGGGVRISAMDAVPELGVSPVAGARWRLEVASARSSLVHLLRDALHPFFLHVSYSPCWRQNYRREGN